MQKPTPIRQRPRRQQRERPGDLIEIVYLSDAEANLDDGAIIDIIEHSRSNNSEHDITGVLLYDGEHFLQVLEGERRHVTEIYSQILADDRHSNVITIHEGRIDARIFDSWGIAYRRIKEDSEILLLARRQLETGRAVDPTLKHIGAWIAAALEPPESYVWSSRKRDLEPG